MTIGMLESIVLNSSTASLAVGFVVAKEEVVVIVGLTFSHP